MDGQGTFCTKCGGRLADGADYCPKCGTQVLSEALRPTEQIIAPKPITPIRPIQADIWLGVLLFWMAGQIYSLGRGDSMFYSADFATIAGALTGMAVFLFVWFFAGSRLRLISQLTKPAADRGKPRWSVYLIISALWLAYTTLSDGLPGLAIGLLDLAYVLFVAFVCYSLSKLSRRSLSSKAMLFGGIGLAGWIIPPLGFLLAAACLYASIEGADAKRIRIGVTLSAIIIVLSMISYGIGAYTALTPYPNIGT
jgi:ribosomal protein L40E